jgi:hypothetical protein
MTLLYCKSNESYTQELVRAATHKLSIEHHKALTNGR